MNVDSEELRNVIRPYWLSEKSSDQNTKYNDITVIKMAWMVETALHKHFIEKKQLFFLCQWRKEMKLNSLKYSITGYSIQLVEFLRTWKIF